MWNHKRFGTSTGGYTQVQRITATCKQKQTPFIRTTKSQLHNVSDRHSTWWKLSSHIFILSPKAANSSWSCSPHTQLKANEFNLYPVKLKESKWIILARVTSPFEAASNSTHRTSQKNFLAHKNEAASKRTTGWSCTAADRTTNWLTDQWNDLAKAPSSAATQLNTSSGVRRWYIWRWGVTSTTCSRRLPSFFCFSLAVMKLAWSLYCNKRT